MFTKVRLRNFRSFDDITFDLSAKNGESKKLVIIYGENGAGKSNLASAFVFLDELIQTMNIRDKYEEILNKKAVFNDEKMEQLMRQHWLAEMRDIQAIINDYRMIDNDQPIIVEYEFSIDGKQGSYCIELGEQEIIYERLEYKLNTRRGVCFECKPKGITINSAIVKDKDLLNDIKLTAKRFWGKHSILAIITHELRDKSKTYGYDNMSSNFKEVLNKLEEVSCNIGIGTREWESLSTTISVFADPTEGRIPRGLEKHLDAAEQIFSMFFASINSDVQKAIYKRTYTDNIIKYKLYLVKMIAGSYRTIDFSVESKGNHQLIKLLCFLLTACNKGTVVLDEADSAIHDLLFKKVIHEISPYISGQLILTTHNTLLMESEIDKGAFYILYQEDNGQKIIRSIPEYEKRTCVGNNMRSKYLNNEYRGLPRVKEINFEEVLNTLKPCVE